jgi:hypothetical protein
VGAAHGAGAARRFPGCGGGARRARWADARRRGGRRLRGGGGRTVAEVWTRPAGWPSCWTATWPAAAMPGSIRRASPRLARRCATGWRSLRRCSRRGRRPGMCGAATATCTSATCACGRAGRPPSTRWNSTRRWPASTPATSSPT